MNWTLISSVVFAGPVFFYLGMLFARRSPREYLNDAMRIRQIDESACAPHQDGVCFSSVREFAVRQGASDYVYFHEIAHQSLADRGLQDLKQDPDGAEAMSDIISWLLCRRTGAGDELSFSSSASSVPGEVLLELNEVAAAFQLADHLFATLCDGGLKRQSTKRSQQNV